MILIFAYIYKSFEKVQVEVVCLVVCSSPLISTASCLINRIQLGKRSSGAIFMRSTGAEGEVEDEAMRSPEVGGFPRSNSKSKTKPKFKYKMLFVYMDVGLCTLIRGLSVV